MQRITEELILSHVTNIPGGRYQVTLAVASFTVALLFLQGLFVDVFTLINIYQPQTDSNTYSSMRENLVVTKFKIQM